jgi:flagellar motor protein MotB
MELLKKSMPEERLAVMGFGEFKPIVKNAPNNQGNPLNRRVEIFIVPRDLEVPSAGLK